MNTYANGTCAMKFPSSYVSMDAEEMTYVDGGANGFWNSRGTIGTIIDVAIAVWTAGAAVATLSQIKTFIKKNKNKVLHQVGGKITSMFGSKAGIFVAAAFDIIMIACGTSVGGVLAYAIDYADGKLNGYCFG